MNDAAARKERSEATLRSRGIPVNEHLPIIAAEVNSTRRVAGEVAARATALMAVAVKGEGHSIESPEATREHMTDLQAKYSLDLTPLEQKFIDEFEPDQLNWVQFSWRYEACWVMHWALGFVDLLAPPTTVCDAATTVRQIHDRGHERYVAEARLRPQSEILDEADLVYRYHWAVREARLNGNPIDGVDPGVVQERHHALNWLIGYGDQAWDDISTDT